MDFDLANGADVLTKRLVVFENDGLIDPIGITTFGVNAKVSENPIGYFGSRAMQERLLHELVTLGERHLERAL